MKTTSLALAVVAALCTPAGADLARSPIQLDAGQQQAIGLTFGTAERRPVEKTIRAAARLDYARAASLNPRSPLFARRARP